MHVRASALTQRQHELLMRSAALRGDLAAQVRPWQRPLQLADELRQGWHWLRTHPEAPLAAAVVLAVLRPRRAWRWGLRLWWAWGNWRRLSRSLRTAR